jgi:hypothetical protein
MMGNDEDLSDVEVLPQVACPSSCDSPSAREQRELRRLVMSYGRECARCYLPRPGWGKSLTGWLCWKRAWGLTVLCPSCVETLPAAVRNTGWPLDRGDNPPRPKRKSKPREYIPPPSKQPRVLSDAEREELARGRTKAKTSGKVEGRTGHPGGRTGHV